MKKLIYLVAPMMCFSALVSCGGGGDNPPDPEPTKEYNVTFMFEGTQYGDVVSVKDGDKVARPENPQDKKDEHFSYTFDNWYTTKEYETPFDFESSITSDITIYGKYNKTGLPHDVIFMLDDAEYKKDSVIEGNTVTKPDNPTKDSDEHYSYSFDKWYTTKEYKTEFSFDTPITKDTTIYGKFNKTGLPHDVTFMIDNIQYGEVKQVTEGEKATRPNPEPSKDPEGETKYIFDNWYTAADCKDLYNFDTPVTSDITIYGKYNTRDLHHSVTFMVDGSQYGSIQTVEDESTATKPTDPKKDPTESKIYSFAGWYTTSTFETDTEYDFTTKVISDLTLYAKFNETSKDQYTVKYVSENSIIKYNGEEFTEKSFYGDFEYNLSIISNSGYYPVTSDEITIKDSKGQSYDTNLYSYDSGTLKIKLKDNVTITAEPEEWPLIDQELCFTSLVDGSDLSIGYDAQLYGFDHFSKSKINLEFKKNDDEWKEVVLDDISEGQKASDISTNLKKGDKVYLRGNNASGISYYNVDYVEEQMEIVDYSFACTEDSLFDISGNIMSLISSSNFNTLKTVSNEYCFEYLFYGFGEYGEYCGVKLNSAKDLVLPAEELSVGAYKDLFNGSGLIEAPLVLPAKNVPDEAYYAMFGNCGELLATPNILAENVGNSSLDSMFRFCEKLENFCELNFKSLGEYGANEMFEWCTSLTTIPLIPTEGVTLGANCYEAMFKYCENLEIKEGSQEGMKMILDTGDADLSTFESIFSETKSPVPEISSGTQYYCPLN